jgi:bacteriorhodopsin
MNGLFYAFLFFAIGSVAIVVIQTVAILYLNSWNKQLRKEVEELQTPF